MNQFSNNTKIFIVEVFKQKGLLIWVRKLFLLGLILSSSLVLLVFLGDIFWPFENIRSFSYNILASGYSVVLFIFVLNILLSLICVFKSFLNKQKIEKSFTYLLLNIFMPAILLAVLFWECSVLGCVK